MHVLSLLGMMMMVLVAGGMTIIVMAVLAPAQRQKPHKNGEKEGDMHDSITKRRLDGGTNHSHTQIEHNSSVP